MSAQTETSSFDQILADPPVWAWARAIDPVVRNLALGVGVAGASVIPLHAGVGLLLLSLSMALLASSRPAAVEVHQERVVLDAALRDLDLRLVDGDLDRDAHAVRRAWLLETAQA